MVGALLLSTRASTPARLLLAAVLAGATAATLPPRLWRPQLLRLGGLCALIFVFTALGGWVGG